MCQQPKSQIDLAPLFRQCEAEPSIIVISLQKIAQYSKVNMKLHYFEEISRWIELAQSSISQTFKSRYIVLDRFDTVTTVMIIFINVELQKYVSQINHSTGKHIQLAPP